MSSFFNPIANVEIKTGDEILFSGHNLFVDTGRTLVRDVMSGDIVLDLITGLPKYAVQFGSSTQTPAYSDADILTPITPPAGVAILSMNTSVANEMNAAFEYTNTTGSDIVFSEVGLFYRPGIDYPAVTAGQDNTLIARIKTNYNSVTIANGKTITLNWKILF